MGAKDGFEMPDDDDDPGGMWKAVRKAQQERRADNRVKSTALLSEKAVSFRAFQGGAHLVVEHNGRTVDFWPGTGRWRERGGTAGFGVQQLLKHVNRENPNK